MYDVFYGTQLDLLLNSTLSILLHVGLVSSGLFP